MRKHLLAMAGAAALGLATAASGPVSAGALQPAPGLGSAADSNVIQVQGKERGGKDAGARSGGQRSGPSDAARGNVRSGKAATTTARRATESKRPRVQRRSVQRPAAAAPRATAQRRGDHRPVRRGWSRDRQHIFYGAYVLGVPFGYATYASHPCYSWVIGPQGPGYYWNYLRCPI